MRLVFALCVLVALCACHPDSLVSLTPDVVATSTPSFDGSLFGPDPFATDTPGPAPTYAPDPEAT